MLTAVTMREMKNQKLGTLDVLERNYPDYYSRYGLELLPIPNTRLMSVEWLKTISLKGIIFSGGMT